MCKEKKDWVNQEVKIQECSYNKSEKSWVRMIDSNVINQGTILI